MASLTVGVVIIGAGFSGIYTLKNCLDQGLDAWVFEKSPRIGGVWNVENKPGGVHDFTFSVTSKLYMSSTEFAPPDEYPEFPHSSLVYKRLDSYTDHFDLRHRIKHGYEAVKVDKNTDDSGWTIDFLVNDTSERVTVNARRIVVATGTNMCPAFPENKKMYDRFKGPVVHSHYYNEGVRDACKGKRVLIVGGSDHASDIASDISKISAPGGVYVSIRDGQWFQDRIFSAEAPADMFYNRLFDFVIKNVVGKRFVHDTVDTHVKYWWGAGGSDIHEWQPKCDYLNAIYNKSRDLIRLVSFGLVKPCGAVKDIVDSTSTIICEGRNSKFDVDVIILCTGYKYKECMAWTKPYVHEPRFKHIFPVEERGRMAFVGYIRPYLTSIPMLIEMQARVVAKVFAGSVQLPDETTLRNETRADEARTSVEFACSAQRVPFIVDPYDYCNALARMIDAYPSWLALLFKEPFLWYCCMYDSWNQYFYRLNDRDNPERRQLAKDVILDYHNHPSSVRIRRFILKLTIYAVVIVLIIAALWTFRCYIMHGKRCS